jgi:L-asparaginase
MDKTEILVIYTGGTIGMVKNIKTGALSPIDFDELYKLLPVLENYDYIIDQISFDPLIDSSDMKPDFWLKLAAIIGENYEKYDGFIVLHGSDTMAYSASVLSFLLENLNKPVVFTGSQLPLGVIRTDGRENFINAIEIAAAQIDQTPIVPEVTVFLKIVCSGETECQSLMLKIFRHLYPGTFLRLQKQVSKSNIIVT